MSARFVIAIGVAAALHGAEAAAADLSLRSTIQPSEPAYTWTGFYAGASAGYALDRYTIGSSFNMIGAGALNSRLTLVPQGPIGGAQVGYNYQTAWNVVLGVEADVMGAAVSGHVVTIGPLVGGSGGLGYANIGTQMNLLGSVRARIGYTFDHFLFTDNVMFFLQAGPAFGLIRDNMSGVVGPGSIAYSNSYGKGQINPRRGGAVGIGVAKMFTPNFSVALDYRYHCLVANQINTAVPGGPVVGFATRSMYHVARVSLNWNLDSDNH